MVRHTGQQTRADKPKSKWDLENRRPLRTVQGQDADARELILFFKIATEHQMSPIFPTPWEVSDLVARGGILGKDQMKAYLMTAVGTAVPPASASRLPTEFLTTAPCPSVPQHPPPHFIWRVTRDWFYRSQPWVSSTHQEPQLAKLVKINAVTSPRLRSVAIGAAKYSKFSWSYLQGGTSSTRVWNIHSGSARLHASPKSHTEFKEQIRIMQEGKFALSN